MKKLLLITLFCLNVIFINAQSWTELGTGANAINANGSINSLTSDALGNVYAAGGFTDSLNPIKGKFYVAKWNGSTWSALGTGANSLNAHMNPNGGITVCSDPSNNIYAAGWITDSNNTINYANIKYYVAKWDGITWSELGTGTNTLNARSGIFSICSDAAGNIYAAGQFTNSNGKQYIAKWNGSSWSEIGTGVNALNANGAIRSIIIDNSENIYVAGQFTNANGKAYVAKWDGNTWSELGTGTSALNASNTIMSMCLDPSGNVYAAGYFKNAGGYRYVAKWNGSTWNELGEGANSLNASNDINSLASDPSGNIYVGGIFKNTTGFYYVPQWNGSSWNEFGTGANALNANSSVSKIYSDASGNIYAAGYFTDGNNKKYVAQFENTTDIATQPTDAAVDEGSTLTFKIGTYVTPNSYQWKVDNGFGFVNIQDGNALKTTVGIPTYLGATTSELTISNVSYQMNNYKYRCLIQTIGGNENSNIAILSINKLTGVMNPFAQSTFQLHPNPAQDYITIKNLPSQSTLRIFNQQGVVMKSIVPAGNIISVADLNTGFYILEIQNENQISRTQLIIK